LASATAAPLRCHLLIGPPASGKTTLARTLAPLLTAPGEPPALVSGPHPRPAVAGAAGVDRLVALHPPLPTCLEWNRHRERKVPEAVIQEMAATRYLAMGRCSSR
jgi:energy-coupling factor transporter ATP-binding protein EcfA2